MEHEQAKQMHAAERYVLGELPEELREQFEQHYCDCPECALDLQTTMSFVATSQQIFQVNPLIEPAKEVKHGARSRWSAWLKPLIAIPALAALVVMLGYEARQIRKSHQETGGTEQALVASADFGLHGGNREAGESVPVRVHRGAPYGLHFDFLPSQTFPVYVGEVQDEAGRVVMQLGIPAERANKEVRFVVSPGRLAPGKYALLIYGRKAEPGPEIKTEVAKFAFDVELIP